MHKGPKIEKKGWEIRPLPSPKNAHFQWEKVHNLSCENEFYLHENEKPSPYQRWALNLVLIQRPGKLGNSLQSSPDSFPVISESPINGHLYKTSTSTTSTRFSYSLIPSSARPWTSRRGSKEVSRAHLRLSVYWTTIGENSYKTKTPKTQMKSEKISIS